MCEPKKPPRRRATDKEKPEQTQGFLEQIILDLADAIRAGRVKRWPSPGSRLNGEKP